MPKFLIPLVITIAVLSFSGCGTKSEAPAASSVVSGSMPETVSSVEGSATPTVQPVPTQSPVTQVPTVAARIQSLPTVIPTRTLTSEEEPRVAPAQRKIGEYIGLRFNVGEGSTITFNVREQLFKLPLPNYATLKTNKLEGEVLLDGGRSSITLDLHSLESDASARDRYVRTRMFPRDRFVTLVVESVSPLPKGFSAGQEIQTNATAVLTIKGVNVPLTFDITAQDLGDRINILGQTEVTWEQLQMPKPTARSVLSVEDEISVTVQLVVHP